MTAEVSILSSKDLLKILPSYLIEEVDNISQDSCKFSSNSFSTPKTENFNNVSEKFIIFKFFLSSFFLNSHNRCQNSIPNKNYFLKISIH